MRIAHITIGTGTKTKSIVIHKVYAKVYSIGKVSVKANVAFYDTTNVTDLSDLNHFGKDEPYR